MVSAEKAHYFIFVDDRARWRVFGLAICSGALVGMLSEFLLQTSLEQSNILSGLTALLTATIGFLAYSYPSKVRKPRLKLRLTPQVYRMGYALAVVILLAAVLGVPVLQSAVLNRTLQRIAGRSLNETTLIETKNVLDSAALGKAKANAVVLSRLQRMINRGLGTPGLHEAAWTTNLAVMHYTSAAFSKPAPTGIPTPPNTPIANLFVIKTLGNVQPDILGSGRVVPPSEGAIYQNIGSVNLNLSSKYSATYIIVSSSTGVELDGEMLRHVWLKNTHVIYNGGPIQLEDVHFVNCTFEVIDNANGIRFASVVLNNPSGVDLLITS
ncbi:MAG: hypothetical protein JO340_21395 [Acidobacteriaceae bacterium]|nr:hypothetical protein [Acidobacteriaceae bacterium]